MPCAAVAVCACGGLRLTLEGEPMLVSSCCCTRCQRRTGSFFGVTVYFRPDQVVSRTGAESLFRRPDATTDMHFCPRCGSQLEFRRSSDPSTVEFSICTLDDPARVVPKVHIFTDHRVPWFETADQLPRRRQLTE